MSNEEKDLARIRAWDRYKEAKLTYAAHRQRLTGWVSKFTDVAQRLAETVDEITGEEMAILPMPIEYKKAVAEYRNSVEELAAATTAAKELGWGDQIK
jgi:hypothetical protein